MQAAIRDRYGPVDVVEVQEIDRPVPAPGEVLVRVRAASVNRADLDGITPRPALIRLLLGVRRPRNRRLGIDVAGVVEAVGPDVTRFKVGDRVFGDLFNFGQGAFAEVVAAPEAAFLAIPAGIGFEDAATLPHSAILAIQGLRSRTGRMVGAGETLLMVGASGNVGPFAIQIAKSRGVEVTGVASTAKLDFVRSLGADHVIDYSAVDLSTIGTRYDWIVDTDSHLSIRQARKLLRPKGVYVTLGGEGRPIAAALVLGLLSSLASDKSAGLMLWWKPFDADDVGALAEMIAAGAIRPAINSRYPLSEAREALRRVDEGRAVGKVLVIPSEDVSDG